MTLEQINYIAQTIAAFAVVGSLIYRAIQCRLFGPEGTQRSVRPRGGEHLTDEELTPWYCRPGSLGPSVN